jgi:hypothetical protein
MSSRLDEEETFIFLRAKEDVFVKDRMINDTSTTFDSRTECTIGVLLASLFCGGIHLIAWNRDFRTFTEEPLWRISGIGTIVYGT